MPISYRRSLVGLMVANLVLVCAYEYFIVNKSEHKGKKMMRENNSIDAGTSVKDIESS